MKKLMALALICAPIHLYAQQKIQVINISEFIFSSADISHLTHDIYPKLRFSFFYHTSFQFHYQLTPQIGVFSAASIRNVGYRAKLNGGTFKQRAYMLGIPLAIKSGDFNNARYMFAGLEMDYAFHYREKYKNGYSQATGAWFAQQIHAFHPSVFIGYSFNHTFEFSFKYYFNNFVRQQNTSSIIDFNNYQVNVFYLCLGVKEPLKKVKKTTKGVLTKHLNRNMYVSDYKEKYNL